MTFTELELDQIHKALVFHAAAQQKRADGSLSNLSAAPFEQDAERSTLVAVKIEAGD